MAKDKQQAAPVMELTDKEKQCLADHGIEAVTADNQAQCMGILAAHAPHLD
jgi:hypothetical protein